MPDSVPASPFSSFVILDLSSSKPSFSTCHPRSRHSRPKGGKPLFLELLLRRGSSDVLITDTFLSRCHSRQAVEAVFSKSQYFAFINAEKLDILHLRMQNTENFQEPSAVLYYTVILEAKRRGSIISRIYIWEGTQCLTGS